MDQLGAEPVEVLLDQTGIWSLRFLLFTLLITPLSFFTGWPALNDFNLRRILGLYAFFYSCLHLLSYLWFEQNFEWTEIFKDFTTRPPIAIGFLSFVLMLFLALTSYEPIKTSLGQHRWKRLHQLIYVIVMGGLVHFWWLTKINFREPFFYTLVLAILLLLKSSWLKNQWLNRFR